MATEPHVNVTTYIPVEMKEKFEKACAAQKRSMSSQLEFFIEDFIAAHETASPARVIAKSNIRSKQSTAARATGAQVS